MRREPAMRFGTRIGLGLIGLLLVNTHAWWRPWTGGVVTPDFARTVPATTVALLVQAVGSYLLLRGPRVRRWSGAVADVLLIGAVLVALTVFLNVYPLDLS